MTAAYGDRIREDVLAVNLASGTVRLFANAVTRQDANAVIAMAIARRGCDEEFYVAVVTGGYKDGMPYQHDGRAPLAEIWPRDRGMPE